MEERTRQLAGLLREAKRAHANAFAHVGGEDPEWPRWYAAEIVDRTAEVIGQPVTVDDLGEAIRRADAAYESGSGRDWPDAYAEQILENYAGRG